MNINHTFAEIPSNKTEWVLITTRIQTDSDTQGHCFLNSWETDCPILQSLYVNPEQRRRGFAQSMITLALKLCQDHEKKALTLVVDKKNKEALRLYQKLGFEVFTDSKKEYWMSYPLKYEHSLLG